MITSRRSSVRRWIVAMLAGCAGLIATPATAQGKPSNASGDDACAMLLAHDFGGTEDAPTQINSAIMKPAAGSGLPYCEVQGVVWRSVRFRIRLPVGGWNKKILVIGSEGQAGQIMDESNYLFFGGRPGVLDQGYAVVSHDAGHPAAGTKWAWHNEEGMIDYGYRGGHVAAVISKAIVKRFYGEAAFRTYHHSCSNGGREGLMMAQRYPWDYDGIIAGAPSMAWADQFAGLLWFGAILKDRSRAGLDSDAARLLHGAVLQQCDKLDNVVDGLLDDPRRCKVKLAPLLCKDAATTSCLTSHQIDLATKLYDGPRRDDGTQIAHPTVMPGSELTWEELSQIGTYAEEFFRYQAFDPSPGPGWTPNVAHLDRYLKRMGLVDSLYSATNPDLTAFKQRGGKLMIYFGWNDAIGGALSPIDYYEKVERLMGGRTSTQSFFKLFMMPGMNHCSGGDGASVFDYLSEMDKWSTTGTGPRSITGYKPNPDGSPEFYRTIKPY